MEIFSNIVIVLIFAFAFWVMVGAIWQNYSKSKKEELLDNWEKSKSTEKNRQKAKRKKMRKGGAWKSF